MSLRIIGAFSRVKMFAIRLKAYQSNECPFCGNKMRRPSYSATEYMDHTDCSPVFDYGGKHPEIPGSFWTQ